MTDKKDARKAIEDLELEKHLARAGAAASAFAQEAVTRAGGFAKDHRETAHGWLDRAESEVDRVTQGKAHDVVAKVRSGLGAGVDAVADQAPDEPGAAEEHSADATDEPGNASGGVTGDEPPADGSR